MSVRYHESLYTLVQAAISFGLEVDDIIVVRDGRGRLIVVVEQCDQIDALSEKLRTDLGSYAGPVPVVTGKPAARLAESSSIGNKTVRMLDGGIHTVRYIERRIVGSNWLLSPLQRNAEPPRLVFGSLKGGVGRSTALSVLASDLARRGKSVLAIDLDIEAPGIGFLLLPEGSGPGEDRRPKFGVIDYLLEETLNGVSDEDLVDFIGVSPFSDGSIDVVPAVGRTVDDAPSDMLAKLSASLVEDNSTNDPKNVTKQLLNLIERLTSRRPYDAVLIDARAGFSEVSAAPLISLAANILLFGTDQQQTFRGYRYLLSHMVAITDFNSIVSETDWREKLTFVHAKAPQLGRDRSRFRERLYDLCSDSIYEQAVADQDEEVFSYAPEDIGDGVPHDSTFIRNSDQGYANFDPTLDDGQLDPELYESVFGEFLNRTWKLLNLERQPVLA